MRFFSACDSFGWQIRYSSASGTINLWFQQVVFCQDFDQCFARFALQDRWMFASLEVPVVGNRSSSLQRFPVGNMSNCRWLWFFAEPLELPSFLSRLSACTAIVQGYHGREMPHEAVGKHQSFQIPRPVRDWSFSTAACLQQHWRNKTSPRSSHHSSDHPSSPAFSKLQRSNQWNLQWWRDHLPWRLADLV